MEVVDKVEASLLKNGQTVRMEGFRIVESVEDYSPTTVIIAFQGSLTGLVLGADTSIEIWAPATY